MKNSGFTLTEMLVAIAIVAILLSVTIPSFSGLIRDTRMGSITNDMVSVLKYARLEAMRTGNRVYVSSINVVSSSNEWGNGVRIWMDSDGDDTYDSAKDEELRIVSLSSGDNNVDVTGGASNFFFSAQGSTSLAANVTVNICDQRVAETGRQIAVLTSGLVSINNTYTCS